MKRFVAPPEPLTFFSPRISGGSGFIVLSMSAGGGWFQHVFSLILLKLRPDYTSERTTFGKGMTLHQPDADSVAVMVLPPELHIYAENILRRFPEEFMALGAPNLEEIYDLRPNGTWSKKMVESSAEKTIEITMRRWSAGNPYAGPPMPSYSPYAMYGGVAVAPPQQAVWSSANAASADENQIVWDLLEWGNLEALKILGLLMEGVACGLAGPNEAYLDIIEWLVRSGADAGQRTPSSSQGNYSIWLIEDPDKTKLTVAYKGHSAISYLLAWKRASAKIVGGERVEQEGSKGELQDKARGDHGDAEWSENLAYLDKALAKITLATRPRSLGRPKVAVDNSIEKVLDATASHNLTFETADGTVTAHAHVLTAASPVLKAMLDSSMQEGESRRIRLEDCSSSSVSLFLETLYTCSTRSDPKSQTVLMALDLAHRWQVFGLVAIFSEGMLCDENFVAIAEAAVLKDLDSVKKACHHFGLESRSERLKKGLLPKTVQDLFGHKVTPANSEQPKKRRRQLQPATHRGPLPVLRQGAPRL
eukprot:s221_g20.t1